MSYQFTMDGEVGSNEVLIDHYNNRKLFDFSFSVTYSYTNLLDELFDDGIKIIYNLENDDIWSKFFNNKTGSYMEPIIKFVINKLGNDEVDEDYFKCTRGNCRAAMETLLDMCKLRPNGVFKVY